jgi:hypothetical protein
MEAALMVGGAMALLLLGQPHLHPEQRLSLVHRRPGRELRLESAKPARTHQCVEVHGDTQSRRCETITLKDLTGQVAVTAQY